MDERKQAADRERRRLKRAFPQAYKDGFAVGMGKIPGGPRAPGGYPLKYFDWPEEQRNAWWSGATLGYYRLHPHGPRFDDEEAPDAG